MKDAKEIINKMIADMEWHKTVNDDCQYQMGIDHCIDIVRCSEKYFENEIPQTNADKIHSMDDEELAKFIEQVSTDSMETIYFGTKEYEEIWEHKETALQWLQSEVEELLEVGE